MVGWPSRDPCLSLWQMDPAGHARCRIISVSGKGKQDNHELTAILGYKMNSRTAWTISPPPPPPTQGEKSSPSILPSSYTDKIAPVLMVNLVKFHLISKSKSVLQMSVSVEVQRLTCFLNEPPVNTRKAFLHFSISRGLK